MAKKEEPVGVNNVNNNTNNVNVNVHIPPKKRTYNKKKKPNWIVKAVVLGIIGLVVAVMTYYLTNGNSAGKPAIIENNTPTIQPNN